MNELLELQKTAGTSPVIVILGSEYLHPEKAAYWLLKHHDIDSLVIKSVTFAQMMVKEVYNAEWNLIFIHLRMPTDKLAKQIAEEHKIPYGDAFDIAEDVNFQETLVDFDDNTPENMVVITYTGESDLTMVDFIDTCALIINHNEYERGE